jgi:hypothetical protein
MWLMQQQQQQQAKDDDDGDYAHKEVVSSSTRTQAYIPQAYLDWEGYYKVLSAFKRQNGCFPSQSCETIISTTAASPGGGGGGLRVVMLGRWLNYTQQRLMVHLDADTGEIKKGVAQKHKHRIERLNQLGFFWGQWGDYYALLVQYKLDHNFGSCWHIPQNYETADGIKLGKWATDQRFLLKVKLAANTGKIIPKIIPNDVHEMNMERIELLNQIGFFWGQWEDYYMLLVLYKLDHHYESSSSWYIPQNYETANGIKLGKWTHDQWFLLRKYLDKEGNFLPNAAAAAADDDDKLTRERITRLQQLGILLLSKAGQRKTESPSRTTARPPPPGGERIQEEMTTTTASPPPPRKEKCSSSSSSSSPCPQVKLSATTTTQAAAAAAAAATTGTSSTTTTTFGCSPPVDENGKQIQEIDI